MCNDDAAHQRLPQRYRRPRIPSTLKREQHGTTSAHQLTLFGQVQQQVTALTYIPEHELVVVASKDFIIRVYNSETTSTKLEEEEVDESSAVSAEAGVTDVVTVFQEHEHVIFEVMHLSDDVIASVDAAGHLKTWHATSGQLLDQIHIPEVGWLYTISALDSCRLAIGTRSGVLVVVTHENGAALTVHKCVERTLMDWINSASASTTSQLLVTTSPGRTATVWDISHSTPVPVSLLHHNRYVSCVTVDDEEQRILVGCTSGEIYIYSFELRPHLLAVVKARSERHRSIIPLNHDLLLVFSSSRFIGVLSVRQESYVAQIKMHKTKWPTALQIAPSGNLIVGGIGGYAAVIQSPQNLRSVLHQSAIQFYSSHSNRCRSMLETS